MNQNDDTKQKQAKGHSRDTEKKYNPSEEIINGIAEGMERFLDQAFGEGKIGFALFLLPYGSQQANYVSNCKREDMTAFLKEFIARQEGKSLHPAPEKAQ